MPQRGSFFRERSAALKKQTKCLRGPKPKARGTGTAVAAKPSGPRSEPDHKNLLQQLRRSFPWHWGLRRAVCKKCRMELIDVEPAARRAQYWHPAKPECPRSRKRVYIEDTVPFARKKYRRARARGARSASKHRPR